MFPILLSLVWFVARGAGADELSVVMLQNRLTLEASKTAPQPEQMKPSKDKAVVHSDGENLHAQQEPAKNGEQHWEGPKIANEGRGPSRAVHSIGEDLIIADGPEPLPLALVNADVGTCSQEADECKCNWNPSYKCHWAPAGGSCGCWSHNEQSCEAAGGHYCKISCESPNFWQDYKCRDVTPILEASKVALHGNIVVIGNEEIYDLNDNGYKGSAEKFDGPQLAKLVFFQYFGDNFHSMIVSPDKVITYGDQGYTVTSPTTTTGVKGTDHQESKIKSLVRMSVAQEGWTTCVLHELEHTFGVYLTDLSSNLNGHWQNSLSDLRGMLGGWPQSAVSCSSGELGTDSCEEPLSWNFDTGAPAQSHDAIGGFSAFDLLLMGLKTPTELGNERLVHCKDANPSWARGVQHVNCAGGLLTFTPQQVYDEQEKRWEKGTLKLNVGDTMRVAAVALIRDPNQVGQPLNDALSFWSKYLVETAQEKFSEYTNGDASLSFAIEDSDILDQSKLVPPAPTTEPTPEPTQNCPDSCYGRSCDFWGQYGYSCNVLENTYRCTCSGCTC